MKLYKYLSSCECLSIPALPLKPAVVFFCAAHQLALHPLIIVHSYAHTCSWCASAPRLTFLDLGCTAQHAGRLKWPSTAEQCSMSTHIAKFQHTLDRTCCRSCCPIYDSEYHLFEPSKGHFGTLLIASNIMLLFFLLCQAMKRFPLAHMRCFY